MVRTRKFIGLLLILVLIVVYSFAAMLIAVHLLPENKLVELMYYAIVGIGWIFPAMWIIRWMRAFADDVKS
jgi:uncharacterized protein DUF2842